MVAVPELVPVPESGIVVVLERCLPLLPIGVQLTTDMPPLAPPLACGEKVTDKLALCSGCRVIGKSGPAKLNPAPLTVACEIVRFDLPLLLTAIDNVLLLPTRRLPKSMREEVMANCPVAALEYRRNLRRTSFHQACLHWKKRRLIPSTLFPRGEMHTVGDDGAAVTLVQRRGKFARLSNKRRSFAIFCCSPEMR